MSISSRGRVLIVEDDLRIAAGLKELLERYLFVVRVAHTVELAFQELVLDQFDVLVLDWILPDGDGRSVISFCRQVSPLTSIVVSSAHRSSDGECTPLADEFVEKGPDVMSLRNAVERSLRLSEERRMALASPTLDRDLFHVAEITWRVLQPMMPADEHFAVKCESERMASAVARFVGGKIPGLKARRYIEIDAKCISGGDFEKRLFGEVRLAPGRLPELHSGLLDRADSSFLIVRNADFLSNETQESLAKSVALGAVRRVGSSREIPSDIRLAITCCDRKKERTRSRFSSSLKRLIGKQMLRIPAPKELKGGTEMLLTEFGNSRTGHGSLINPGEVAIVARGNWGQSWDSLFPAIMQKSTSCDDDSFACSYFPHIEASFVQEDAGPRVAKWKDVEDLPKAFYICRLLELTGGNVSEAVECSGIRRNTIYETLKKYSLTADQFRNESSVRS